MHWVSILPMGSQQLPQHIRGTITNKENDYLLEISNFCEANSELLALAALAPEIREFLEMFESPIAELLLEKWNSMTLEIHRDQRQPDKPADEAS